jgi:flagellar biosynthesis activator protein FlaF
MFANQLETYRQVQKTTMSGREMESSVLTKAAQLLKDCQIKWDAKDRDSRLDEALKFNQQIWSIFQAELSKEDNPLPRKLREDILSLSLLIDKRIFDIMAFPAPEKLNIIININLNIAAGLRGSPQ